MADQPDILGIFEILRKDEKPDRAPPEGAAVDDIVLETYRNTLSSVASQLLGAAAAFYCGNRALLVGESNLLTVELDCKFSSHTEQGQEQRPLLLNVLSVDVDPFSGKSKHEISVGYGNLRQVAHNLAHHLAHRAEASGNPTDLHASANSRLTLSYMVEGDSPLLCVSSSTAYGAVVGGISSTTEPLVFSYRATVDNGKVRDVGEVPEPAFNEVAARKALTYDLNVATATQAPFALLPPSLMKGVTRSLDAKLGELTRGRPDYAALLSAFGGS